MEEEDSVSINPTPLFRPPPPRMQTLDDIQLVSPSSSQLCEESTNSCKLYTPQVKNELIPRINQQFRNLEDVYSFYNNYAFHAGFSVRINSSKTDKNGELSRKDYVCFKEGESRISKANTTRRRGSTREKCGAKLVVVRARSGEGFVVSNFVEGHSHRLTSPKKTHFLKSYMGMSEIYTQSIFYMFQEEIFQINAYVVTLRHEDEHRCLWEVRRPDMEGSRSREISVEKSSNLVSCSCKMFDFDGIPCRHMLAYFSRMQMTELPTEYILWRWTKSAKASRVMDDLGSVGKEICDRSILVRRHGLFQLACNVIDDGVLDEEGTEVVSKHLLLAKDELAVLRSSREPLPPSGMEMATWGIVLYS